MTHDRPKTAISPRAVDRAEENIRDVLTLVFEHTAEQRAIVVWDGECELARALTEAYGRCLPQAQFIEFRSTPPDTVMASFEGLSRGDFVALIQSTSFRLHAFRIRLELFRRGLKVIEHPHLSRMPGAQGLTYIESLAYDADYNRGVGRALKQRIDGATEALLEGDGERLVFPAGLEPAKLNVGDYSAMKNAGGQYPIGEVFTESKDLEAVNGRIRISFFGDTDYRVNKPPVPITLVIEAGRVVEAVDSTPEFDQILNLIRAGEGQVWVRGLGLGLNRALTEDSVVSDVGTFERMCGVHLSLGAKHTSYNKPNIRKKAARFHVDVFLITDSMTIDGEVVYCDRAWQVGA